VSEIIEAAGSSGRPAAGQIWDAGQYAHHAGFVAVLGRDVLELLAPRPNERILDLGCGDGALTAELAATGAIVTGVDASPEQVAAAEARGLDARVADGCRLPFDGGFDAVFSNAALHWMNDHDAVLAGVRRALKPGGRFVAEMGGHGNVAAIRVALAAVLQRHGVAPRPSPWYFPTAAAYAARLAHHGFEVVHIGLLPRLVTLPTGMAGWLETFAAPCLATVPDAEHARIRADVVELLRPCLCDAEGAWTADYVRLRFAARRSD
jgi:Trans-aconitate methyltransferase